MVGKHRKGRVTGIIKVPKFGRTHRSGYMGIGKSSATPVVNIMEKQGSSKYVCQDKQKRVFLDACANLLGKSTQQESGLDGLRWKH